MSVSCLSRPFKFRFFCLPSFLHLCREADLGSTPASVEPHACPGTRRTSRASCRARWGTRARIRASVSFAPLFNPSPLFPSSIWHYLRSPHPRSSTSSLPICTRLSIHTFSMYVLANSPPLPASALPANPPASHTTASPASPIRPLAAGARRSATGGGRYSTRI
jgi:hypothetical protein